MKKRFWALFLAVMMIVSVLPTTAFAADEEVDKNLQPDPRYYSFAGKELDKDEADNADITLSKTAEYIGDGKYEITLSVDAGAQILPKPTEVVFVLDASGSMNFCTDVSGYESHSHDAWGQCGYNSSTETCNFLKEHKHVHTWDRNSIAYCTLTRSGDKDSRWDDATAAIESMKDKIGTENITYRYVYFKSVQNNHGGWPNVAYEVSSYSEISPGGGTPLYLGVEEGIDCFTEDPMSNKVLIIVADGAADKVEGKGTYPKSICDNFKAIAGNTIYTVGFTFSDKDFNDLASEGCDFTAGNADDLELAMDTISKKISGMIVDPMGDGVTLDNASIEINQNQAGINVNDGTINWSDAKGISGKVTMTYNVTVNVDEDEDHQEIPLNGDAKLHYTYTGENGDEKSCSISFPVPVAVIQKEPEIFNVTYFFESGTEGKALPAAINEYLPAVGTALNGDTVKPATPEQTTYEAVDGTWTFNGWDYDSLIVAGDDIEFVGTWSFEIAKYDYTVEYYYDGVIDSAKTETLSAEYGAKINEYEDKSGNEFMLESHTAPIIIGAEASENVIEVYYVTDVWNDEKDKLEGGDKIPDKHQVCVEYVSSDATKGTVTPALDVITLYAATGAYATVGDVTTSEATATAIEGNGFKNWTDYNSAVMEGEDETLSVQTIKDAEGGETYTYTAIFSAATQPGVVKIPYYIEHYQEQLDGTYVKAETETKFDVKDQEITIVDADYKSYANYAPNKTHASAVLSGKVDYSVDPTGGDTPVVTMLTLKLYYDLDKYTVTFVDEDGTILEAATEYAYGTKAADIVKPANPTKAADADYTYTFSGWTPAIADVTNHATYKATYSATPREAKLSVADKVLKTTDEINEGSVIAWKITVQNDGNKDAQLVAGLISDTIYYGDTENGPWTVLEGASVTFPETLPVVEAGKTAEIEVTWIVPASVVGKYIKNAAKVNGEEGSKETPPAYVVPEPGVSITKVADDTSVYVGEKITYTIVVTNTGNVDLTNVVVTDDFIKGGDQDRTWTIDKLTVKESKTFTFEYKTVYADRNGLSNVAIADSKETDPKTTDSVYVEVEVEREYDRPDPKPALNKEDHYAYIVGYPDGLVHPERNITRAEVSTIFFRMLLDESREDFWSQENWFSDVPADQWYNNAVSTLSNAGLITGYPDGSFKPNANITRAEFATIAIRFFLEEDVEITENNLTDIKGHWAEANINLAYALNLINGYPDNTFRPDQKITRAEAMTIVNRVLERHPHEDHLLEDMIEWPDNMDTDAWYYADVQEATNSHEFYKTEIKGEDEEYEVWTELLPVRDWAALEREWSQANSSKNPGEVVDININTPEAGNNGTLKLN